MARRFAGIALIGAAVMLLAGCAPEPTPSATPPSPTPSGSPSEPAEPGEPGAGPVQPVGDPVSIATGLDAPWSIERLPSGSTLISERDSAMVKELTAAGDIRDVGQVAGVEPGGEGGLLGLDTLAANDNTWLYAYFTASGDNRIVRMPLLGESGDYSLGDPENVLTGLAKAGNHNGGRIKFGPDGMLYATVGDAGEPSRAQDRSSPNGKILRMTPTGAVPGDNPFARSLVYSLGHRNPQGIAWDGDGQLWAAEFGQNTWDEFNRIEAGENYGWPVVEGASDDDDFVDPTYQWSTDDASPSGLAFARDTFFLAALRGQRVWAIYPGDATNAVSWFDGQFGRIRDVTAGPDGTLWFLTNNTDGRGTPGSADDQIFEVQLAPLVEG